MAQEADVYTDDAAATGGSRTTRPSPTRWAPSTSIRSGQAVRKLGVSEQTYYRWRREYGGMRVDERIAVIKGDDPLG